MGRKIVWKTLGGLTALFLYLMLPGAAGADDISPQKQIDRAKLSESFRNTGTQGAMILRWGYTGNESSSMQYPFIFTGEYAGTGHSRAYDADNSKGEGVFILAKDTAGDVYVTSSGPAYISGDVKQGVIDLTPGSGNLRLIDGTDHPFTQTRLGYDTKDANAWFNSDQVAPEQPAPVSPGPVEISNYRENGDYTLPRFDHFPEEIVITRWTSDEGVENGTGLTMTRYAYGWSHSDFDDFFIVELIVENTSSRDYDEVYVAYLNYFSLNKTGHEYKGGWRWEFLEGGELEVQDDRYQYTEAANYAGKYRGMRVSYQYDGDGPYTSENDQGEPRFSSRATSTSGWLADEELYTPQYIGWGPVDVVPPFVNDPETYVPPTGTAVGGPDIPEDQPRYSHWWKRRHGERPEFEPHEGIDTVEEMWEKFVTPGKPIDDNPVDGGPKPGEQELQEQLHTQAYGPYRLRQGEKAKIVVVFAGGMASEVAGPGGEPMDKRLWAMTPGAQAALPNGEDVLFNHIERARSLYRMGYDLPDQPPDVPSAERVETDRPLLLQSNADGNMEMTWTDGADDATHPDYTGAEANDIAGYRIYSTTGFSQDDPVKHAGNASGPWRAIASISVKDPKYYSGGIYTFADRNSITGFTYWYNIVPYSKGHNNWENINAQNNIIAGAQASMPTTLADLPEIVQKHIRKGVEASHITNAARHNPNGGSVRPVMAASTEADALQREIFVVPNPWKDDGVHSFGAWGANNRTMRIVNLPRLARIWIHNAAGDLINEIVHDGTRGSQHTAEVNWSHSARSGTGQAGPGLYFFAVESLVPGHEGKIQTGSFVIIK